MPSKEKLSIYKVNAIAHDTTQNTLTTWTHGARPHSMDGRWQNSYRLRKPADVRSTRIHAHHDRMPHATHSLSPSALANDLGLIGRRVDQIAIVELDLVGRNHSRRQPSSRYISATTLPGDQLPPPVLHSTRDPT